MAYISIFQKQNFLFWKFPFQVFPFLDIFNGLHKHFLDDKNTIISFFGKFDGLYKQVM